MKRGKGLIVWVLLVSMLTAGCGIQRVQETDNLVELGTLQKGVYRSTFLGIQFAPADWRILTAEDLQGNLRVARAQLEGSALQKELKNLVQIVDMQAASSDDLMTANIIYTKKEQKFWSPDKITDDDTAMNAVLEEQETLISAYEEQGISIRSVEKKKVTLAETQRTGILLSGSFQQVPCYILQIYEQDLGDYSAVITMTSFGEDRTEEIAGMFEILTPEQEEAPQE